MSIPENLRSAQIIWDNIEPLDIVIVTANVGGYGIDGSIPRLSPISQEDRKDFVKFTPAKIEKPK